MYKKFEDLLDSPRETFSVNVDYEARSDLSIYFFPNGEEFTEDDYDQIISIYNTMFMGL